MGDLISIFMPSYENQSTWIVFSLLVVGIFIVNFHSTKRICDNFLLRAIPRLNFDFDYGIENGPHTWKRIYPASQGCFQSPINIRTETTEILKISEPLLWRFYDDLPFKVVIENTGNTVELKAHYMNNQPTLAGADLLESYSFVSLCFRWSMLNDDGSEHSINNRKFPLELQATHISKDSSQFDTNYSGDLGILVLSYVFIITKYDNPYLDPIILNLHLIREPLKSAEIPAFPISWLCYPFKSGFYSYGGSLSEPPCSEGVTWFIQPEPLPISEKQLAEFRKLFAKNGTTRISKNSRPVQNLNSRIVCYNRYDHYCRFTEDPVENVQQA